MPSTLATRAAGRVIMTYPASRRYVMAARAIQGAWRHRRTIKRAAKYVYRARKRARTSKVGRRATAAGRVRNVAMKKQDAYPTGLASTGAMGRIHAASMPWPELTTTNTLTSRQRNTIHITGIKICRQFTYPAPATDVGPIELHWCLVQAKDPAMQSTSLDYQNDFFRDNNTNTSRSVNFPTYTGSSPWNMLMNCAPMNPNGKLKILTHRKFALVPYNANNYADKAGVNRQPHYVKIDRYFKINKNFNWDNDTDVNPQNQIFELWWYNTIEPSLFPADPTAVNYLEWDKAHTVYWKNNKS